jgi:hypothetical protein
MPSAPKTSQELWNAYQRASSRAHALGRETDQQWTAYEAALHTEKEARADADVAHEAYMKSLREMAVIVAAEDIAFAVPHLDFTE